MANVLVEETSLSNIASAIRGKNGSTAVYKPGEMAAAISNLSTGGSSGGSSDIEDGLLENTLVNYENTRVTKIKPYCFYQSNTLSTASFPNVTEVGEYSFQRCIKLSNVNLPKVKTIGNSAFWYSGLSSINLPQAGTIWDHAFSECPLEKVDLGSYTYFKGYCQFDRCRRLTTLILRGNNVPSVEYSVTSTDSGVLSRTPFDNPDKEAYLYVPRALVGEYKKATNWTVIADRIRAIEDYPEITGG